jgi:NDP-sugar pyrophosphorylase family protein
MKYEMIKQLDSSLYRIYALKDFLHVKAGDRGGLVENEHNLSQEGDCWIDYYSMVLDTSKISENARIYGRSTIEKNSFLKGDVFVEDSHIIHSDVYDQASIRCTMCTSSVITGKSYVQSCIIGPKATISDNSRVMSSSIGYGCEIRGDANLENWTANFGPISKISNKLCQIYALFGILPVQGVYTFFVDKKTFGDLLIINHNPRLENYEDLLAVSVHEKDIFHVQHNQIYIQSYLSVKEVSPKTENMSKLDLILED